MGFLTFHIFSEFAGGLHACMTDKSKINWYGSAEFSPKKKLKKRRKNRRVTKRKTNKKLWMFFTTTTAEKIWLKDACAMGDST